MPLSCNARSTVALVALLSIGCTTMMLIQVQRLHGLRNANKNLGDIPTTVQHHPRLPVRVGQCVGQGDAFFDVYASLLPYMFPPDQYDLITINTSRGIVTDGPDVDFLNCLGYFYPQNLTERRAQIRAKYGRLDPPNGTELGTTDADGVHWPRSVDLVPHRDRPFQLAFSHEAWDRGNCRFDALITCRNDFRGFHGCPLIFWADYASSFFRRADPPSLLPKLIRAPDFNASGVIQSKTKFCAFVVGHCFKPYYRNNNCLLRVILHDILAKQYKRPSSFGGCRNTEGYGLGRKITKDKKWNDLDKIVEVFKPFKFSLVFENDGLPGYVSEKIINGALAETIPIYWGAPDIGKFINLDRIVHCTFEGPELDQFRQLQRAKTSFQAEELIKNGAQLLNTSMQPCLDEIIKLDQSPDLYAKKLSQPLLPRNQLEGSHFDLKTIASSIRSVLVAYNSSLV